MLLLIRINGLPAHALLVHLTVVLVPLAALGAIAYLVPGWRDWLRWPLLVGAVVSVVSIWASFLTGQNFEESNEFFQTSPLVQEHEDYAEVFRIVGTVFTLALIGVTAWFHRRAGVLRTLLVGATAVLAAVTLVYVFLTGEAGAKAVYPPESSSIAAARAPVVGQ
jgi:uncharacterized membrane protein